MLIRSETGSKWRIILGHPQLIECMGICVLSLAHGSELRGSDVYLHFVRKKNIRKTFFKFNQSTCPCMAFDCNFFRDFSDCFKGDSVE